MNAPTDSGNRVCGVAGTWVNAMTITNPAYEGQAGLARVTMHLQGGLSGSWTGDAANGIAAELLRTIREN